MSQLGLKKARKASQFSKRQLAIYQRLWNALHIVWGIFCA